MSHKSILTDEDLKKIWDDIQLAFNQEPFRLCHYVFAQAVIQAVNRSKEIEGSL